MIDDIKNTFASFTGRSPSKEELSELMRIVTTLGITKIDNFTKLIIYQYIQTNIVHTIPDMIIGKYSTLLNKSDDIQEKVSSWGTGLLGVIIIGLILFLILSTEIISRNTKTYLQRYLDSAYELQCQALNPLVEEMDTLKQMIRSQSAPPSAPVQTKSRR